MAKLAAPSGFRDFLPDQFRKRQELVRRIRETYESFGFEGMDTPAMESLRVFLGKAGGENEKLMFHVLKRGAELERALAKGGEELSDMALRFDLTVPLARYYATHRGELPAVFKRYQCGPVWRAERAQHGRFREFVQCDVDVLGSSSMAVEAEVVLATTTALAALGFSGLTVRLNSRPLLSLLVRSAGVGDEHLGAAVIGIDKLDKESPAAVKEELTGKGISEKVASSLLDLHARSRGGRDEALLADVEARAGKAAAPHVAQLREILALTPPLPAGRLAFDPFLARGMDYYTGPIFEVAAEGVPFSLAGGGRFDDLIERLAGAKVPACGFSIGFERVFMLMEERGMFGGGSRGADVLVVVPAAEATAGAIRLGAELRQAGLRVDVFPHAAKLGAQFELAEKKGIPLAVVADAAKLGSGTLEVRDLATRTSTPVARAELAGWIRARRATHA
ncbi:MAG TPA: histidine--tRNA ligase [Candidatus Eisenbacteria bacterium]|nr:histidine--tRNA ligase [Candidatus Eisenbacteria bacterium]